LAERSTKGPAVQRSRVASIVAAIAALMLVYAIAGPALAQSPSPGATGSPTAAASPTGAASPGGVPSPSPTQPDTAIGDRGVDTAGGSPVWFLLLGIGAVAAVLVYMGMRGSELRKAPAGSERDTR
jgi:hypothetical protein